MGPMLSVTRAIHSISCAGAIDLSLAFAFGLGGRLCPGCSGISAVAEPGDWELVGAEVALGRGRAGAWYSLRGRGGSGGAGVGNKNVPFGTGRARGREWDGMGGCEKMWGRRWVRCRWRVCVSENGSTKLNVSATCFRSPRGRTCLQD